MRIWFAALLLISLPAVAHAQTATPAGPQHAILFVIDALAAMGVVKLISAGLEGEMKIGVDRFVGQLVCDVRREAERKERALHEFLIGSQKDGA